MSPRVALLASRGAVAAGALEAADRSRFCPEVGINFLRDGGATKIDHQFRLVPIPLFTLALKLVEVGSGQHEQPSTTQWSDLQARLILQDLGWPQGG